MSTMRKIASDVLPRKYQVKLRNALHPAQRLALGRAFAKPMPDKGLLSVVIPVFNVADYVAQCLTSVVGQSYTNLQIIIVDDGSTDDSMLIVDKFAKWDKRISVVRLKNGGNGRARNIGVSAAKGEYLTFADSDDVVAPGAYALMMDTITKTRSDFVVGSSVRLIGKKRHRTKLSSQMHEKQRLSISIDEFPDILDDVFLWNKIFNRNFWDTQVAPIPEGVLYEDQETTARAFVRAHSFDVLEEIVYFWRQRSDGSSITQGKRAQKDIDDRMSVANNVTSLLVSESTPPVVEKWFVRLLGSDLVPYYGQLPYTDEAYWRALSTGATRLFELMIESVDGRERISRQLDPHARVMLRLAAMGMKDELEQVIVDRSEVGTGYKLDVRDGRFYAIPNYWNQLPECSRPSSLECDPSLLPLDSHVDVRGWTPAGELMLSGHGFIRGLSDQMTSAPIGVATRAEDGSWSELTVEPTAQATLDGRVNDSFALHKYSAFEAVVPISLLKPDTKGMITIKVLLIVSGHKFEQLHSVSVPGRSIEPKLETPRVRDFSVKIETEECHVDVHWGSGQLATQLYLATQNHRLDPVRIRDLGGNVVRYEFTLEQQFWGRRVRAPHSGSYTLRYRRDEDASATTVGKSMGVTQALLWKVPLDYRLRHANVQAWLTGSGSFAVTFSAPLDEEERGRYWQRQLQQIFSHGEREIQNHLVFESFGGKSCADSPLQISHEISRLYPKTKIYWSIVDYSVPYPEYADVLIRGSAEWYKCLSSARMLVNNQNFPNYFLKNPQQRYLQTWHGTPLKKVGLDAPKHTISKSYREVMRRESSEWDGLLVQNDFSEKILRGAFDFRGDIICQGYPRNDSLRSPDSKFVREKTRQLLGVRNDETLILYAPTWRDTQRDRDNNVIHSDTLSIEGLVHRLNGRTKLITRSHHNIVSGRRHSRSKFIIDVSDYPDINDLLLAADILISDYSSIMFDFSILEKPMMLYSPDLDVYRDIVRGFYTDYGELAGVMYCATEDELRDKLDQLVSHGESGQLNNDVLATVRVIKQRFAPLDDGAAGKRVLRWLVKNRIFLEVR